MSGYPNSPPFKLTHYNDLRSFNKRTSDSYQRMALQTKNLLKFNDYGVDQQGSQTDRSEKTKQADLRKQSLNENVVDKKSKQSNQHFYQQVVQLKEKYDKIQTNLRSSHEKKECDQFLNLYEKYLSKQSQNTPNSENQPTKQLLQQSTSMHQLVKQSSSSKNHLITQSIHRLSLDNYTTDVSNSMKGLKSYLSINNKSSNINYSNNSLSQKNNEDFSLSKKDAKPPLHLLSQYYASHKGQMESNKFQSLGVRSQTVDQLEIRGDSLQQLGNSDSNLFANIEDGGNSNILIDDPDYRISQKSQEPTKQEKNKRIYSSLANTKQPPPLSKMVTQQIRITEELRSVELQKQPQTTSSQSQPSSTKNGDSSQKSNKKNAQYFRFPEAQNQDQSSLEKLLSRYNQKKPDASYKQSLNEILQKTKLILHKHSNRANQLGLENKQLKKKLSETTKTLEQAQMEIQRLKKIIQ